MIKLLLNLLNLIFGRKSREKKAQKKKKNYVSLKAALPYSLAALLIFGIQSAVATMGALEMVFLDLPSPISFERGRAIHLNFSVYWPLLGSMGLVYYFFIKEAETELYSTRLAWIQFWIFFASVLGIISSLALGLVNGREYREAAMVFDLAVTFCFTLFAYNLIRTYLKSQSGRGRIVLMTMLLGAISLLILGLPNIISYVHPTMDEVFRFWAVHLWEELSKELLLFGVFIALIIDLTGKRQRILEKILFIQSILLIIGATFATGHHYYWVGAPAIWLFVGVIFSIIQVTAIFCLIYIAYIGFRSIDWHKLNPGTKLAMGFIFSSVFYHIVGAAVMGMVISIPGINRYGHGTYLTSAHSHLALFGAVGMMVLGGCTYVLMEKAQLSKVQSMLGWMGLALLNMGLTIMSFALIIAGLLQTYMWHVAGGDFMEVQLLVRPYLIIRAGGGAFFAAGGILYVYINMLLAWRNRSQIFGK